MPRVLVVDDEVNPVQLLAAGLTMEGFEVVTANDAESALVVMRETKADAAIVDLMMPRTNGLQLARQLHEEFPMLRVVLTSGYGISERQLLRTDCGAVGFVPKPYNLAELAAFLRKKLNVPNPSDPPSSRPERAPDSKSSGAAKH